MERITHEQLYINIAIEIAKMATCQKLSVGCVITQNNRIISTGYNGPLKTDINCDLEGYGVICGEDSSCRKAVHAEANAVYNAAKLGISLDGATMYCTHSPCEDCCEAIIQSGIKKVVFKEKFRDTLPIKRLRLGGISVNQLNEFGLLETIY